MDGGTDNRMKPIHSMASGVAKQKILSLILILTLSTFFLFPTCYSQTDTLPQGQQLSDWQNLTSQNDLFILKFFSLPNSPNRYLGIFYNVLYNPYWAYGDQSTVWVANRNFPINGTSGNLGIDSDGRLKISYGSSGSSSVVLSNVPSTSNLSATLLNNGDFVLREMDSNGSRVLWESFDYPTDTLLPGMRLGINFTTGHVWSLTSWMSDVLPASGSFTFGVDPNNTTQLIIWWRGNVSWRSGPWRDGGFVNTPASTGLLEPGYEFSYVSTADEKYFTYSVNSDRTYYGPPRYSMDPNGYITHDPFSFASSFGHCFQVSISYQDPGCEEHGWPEFRGKNYEDSKLEQGDIVGDGFRYSDSSNMSLFDCETACYNNCSCIAYAATSSNKTGCMLYDKGTRFYESIDSLDQYYILPPHERELKPWMVGLVIGFEALFVILLCCLCCCIKRKRHRWRARERLPFELESNNTNSTPIRTNSCYIKDEKMSEELQSFSFKTIAAATNNFDTGYKLGEGGFGPVYKGRLVGGEEVAIKRLARSSGQGLREFKNEILLIAKLQHTNLVRLLGCCIQGQEKILVYEYMPNKSLDYFLFKRDKKELLKWTTLFNIIQGIAQGLLYLHKYSRLRIIHRDLKASNILLDENFNAKISDFGMARIFGTTESEAKTIRVVGTYGYMSPEYAMNGTFSVKSDVYSFGVLLLEIVSSKRNNDKCHSERQLNLNGLAWELWSQGRAEELIDAALDDFCTDQALRCIHVSLLCAQENAIVRPSMSDVVSMLTNETLLLPIPKQPAFFINTRSSSAEGTSRKDESSENRSVNGLTISMVQAR